ncbi:MAG: restriction endonuclease subunit R, partial [Planctomycetaceae bacterium]
PAYFATMSKLLDEVIAARKANAVSYEQYLAKIAELVKKVTAGNSEGTPASLDTPGRRALFNNLGQNEELALAIDSAVREARHDDWRGVQAREQVIKRALFDQLNDVAEVERVFKIVEAQGEY